MRVAYFDCFAGISGDMTLGALLDAGVSVGALKELLDGLSIPEWDLRAEQVLVNGISATDVTITAHSHVHERSLAEIKKILDASRLPAPVLASARAIFRRIGEAEAKIHGTTPDQIHFHELGGIDSIIDIVGVATCLHLLGVQQVHASALPLSHGFVDCAHGRLPVPAPAVLELLVGAPTYNVDVEGELITPTGAGILAELAKFERPAMRTAAIGYGSGKKRFPAFPNVLRVVLADTDQTSTGWQWDKLVMLESNIDDMNPEFYDHVINRLFATGALDVFLTDVQMKKNRPGIMLNVLCEPSRRDDLMHILVTETTTLGIRVSEVDRACLDRQIITVNTAFGPVRVKCARLVGDVVNRAPEYDDCARLAAEHGVPVRCVYDAAAAAAR